MNTADLHALAERLRGILDHDSLADLDASTLAQALSKMLVPGNGVVTGSPTPQPHIVPASRRVLLVDDDPVVAATTQAVLHCHGFICRIAVNADEALRLARSWKPDTLLTDIVLPGINGINLARVLRSLLPELHVVFCSGHPAATALLPPATELASAPAFFPKPLDPRHLLRALRAF